MCQFNPERKDILICSFAAPKEFLPQECMIYFLSGEEMKSFLRRAALCFQSNEEEIMRNNWSQVRVMTYIYMAFLVLYYLAVCLPVRVPAQNQAVLAALIAQAGFSVSVSLKKDPPKSSTAEYAVLMIFGVMIMTLSIYLGTYVFRDNTAWLFLIEVIMLTQFYTMPPVLKCIELLTYLVVFVVCSCIFKGGHMALLDALAGASAVGVGLVSYFSLMFYKMESFENQDELSRMCSLDGMTGLMNKTTFMHFSSLFLKSAPISRPYALAILDVDHFKDVNDRHGHMAGDEVLKMLASCLKRQFPEGDYETGRFGGDEFTVLIKQAHLNDVEQQFRALMKQAAEETEQKVGFPITISVGIAYSIGRELMFPDLFVTADRALYEAKEKEGNTISVKEMNQQEREAPVIAAVDLNEQELKTVRTQCGKLYEVIATDSGLDTRRLLERRKQKVQMVLMSAHQSSFRRAEALSSIHQIRSIHKVPVILIVGE